jgi:hypothetical protein
VVSVPPAETSSEQTDSRESGDGPPASAAATASGEGGIARINLRLPEQLKSAVEQSADREGLSINAWLVRAVAAAVDRGHPGGGREQWIARSGQRYTGWGR